MHNIIDAHKRIERALWCLAKVAEQATEAITILDLNGTIQFVNAAWVKMHRYNSSRQLVGKHISVFHTKEQFKTDVIPFVKETKRRGQLAGTVQHVRKDGSPLLTETKMTMVTDETHKPIALIVFATDTTEKKRTEDQLREHRSQLKKRIERLSAELTEVNEKLQQQISEHEQAEEQLLESIIDADGPAKPIEPPFNPQELKALSELAKRLT